MSRRALAFVALTGLSACGGGPALPEQDLFLRVSFDAEDVVAGRAFPLTVVRAWNKDLEPAAWDERALAPLVLRLEETSRREDARHVEETRRYRAYAFARGDVLVPAAKWTARPKDGGPELSVLAERRRLRVTPEVEARKPGPPELPGEPLAEPASPWGWVVGVAVALLALALRRRRRPFTVPPPPPAAPPAAADVAARRRLDAIGARAASDAAGRRADVLEVSAVLRDFVAARFQVPTRERTSEEVLAALVGPGGAEARVRARLADLCGACDLVKFAAHAPTGAEHAALIAGALEFVAAAGPRP